jgi:hypothetical protein
MCVQQYSSNTIQQKKRECLSIFLGPIQQPTQFSNTARQKSPNMAKYVAKYGQIFATLVWNKS